METLEGEYQLLNSDSMTDLLQYALTGDPDARLTDFRCEVDAVHHRPGAEVSVGYVISYTVGDQPVEEYLVATTADVTGQVAELSQGDLTLRVWRHPDDPRLPGLADACQPETVAAWLTEITGSDAPSSLEVLAYRPLRRAVLRAVQGDRVFYLKVLPRKRADALATRHTVLGGSGLAPELLGRPGENVLIIPAARGRSYAQALVAAASEGLGVVPTPAQLVDLLDRLPAEAMSWPRRDAWSDRLDFHTHAAATALPERADEVHALARDLQPLLDAAPVGPVVPTHGDFYEANLYCDPDGTPSHLIDLDSVGPGRREDDLACLLGHLAVLPSLAPESYPMVPEHLAAATQDFESRVDPVALRARVAAVILSLVPSGSPEVRSTWLAEAQGWARSAVTP
ncbi:phosphotransferase [Aestuariimicrobium ganziense]|uniref:phosphotransferase n=1 Tax=Aestuariimicrobium ganziense TaxID=2773677 RepID=UPI001941C952|nr:phosphotransferase [Aestuariimicrobium ganziense]